MLCLWAYSLKHCWQCVKQQSSKPWNSYNERWKPGNLSFLFHLLKVLLIGISLRLQRKLQNIQWTSASLITKRWKFDSITSQPIELHWLQIKQRIDYKVLMLAYKALHNQAPPHITNMIQINVEWRHLPSSRSTLLFEPRTYCVTFGDHAFSTYAPRIWNEMPSYIKNSQFETFKMLLKTHLFQEA